MKSLNITDTFSTEELMLINIAVDGLTRDRAFRKLASDLNINLKKFDKKLDKLGNLLLDNDFKELENKRLIIKEDNDMFSISNEKAYREIIENYPLIAVNISLKTPDYIFENDESEKLNIIDWIFKELEK